MESPDRVLDRGLRLLAALVQDGGRRPLTEVAAAIGLSRASAHRAASMLQGSGYLIRSRRGYYHAGPMLAALGQAARAEAVVAGIARPILAGLARRLGCLAHFGVFEQDMVTYLLKEGAGKDVLFTRADMQLEAYCSGLGKVLLAAQEEEALAAYLDNGPFVRLTPHTLVEPDDLRREIARARDQGFALDRFEAAEDLFCIAVPLRDGAGQVFAAVSLSFPCPDKTPPDWSRALESLKRAAGQIEERMRDYWGGERSSGAVP